jgi:hypothetical protein
LGKMDQRRGIRHQNVRLFDHRRVVVGHAGHF